MILDGTTSNVTRTSMDSQISPSIAAYTSITLHQRTNTAISPGSYTCSVYAYVNDGTDVKIAHADTFILGHLTDSI